MATYQSKDLIGRVTWQPLKSQSSLRATQYLYIWQHRATPYLARAARVTLYLYMATRATPYLARETRATQ
jgi:hypothetical protein